MRMTVSWYITTTIRDLFSISFFVCGYFSGLHGIAWQHNFSLTISSQNRNGSNKSCTANFHIGTAFSFRDVRRFLCPSRYLCQVIVLSIFLPIYTEIFSFDSIADFSDPRDRMVQVVRWYLSAFHAGRRSEVAKKPYNPILGETFRCWWDVGDDTHNDVPDGPVPWCNTNQLAFIAEQVSHHPPGNLYTTMKFKCES